MLEITLTCPECDTQNSVPVEDGASEFTCVNCGAVSPITQSLSAAQRFAQDPNIGKVISGFEIVEKVGEGGFGSVYKATDNTLQRSVALKLLKRELTDKPEFVHKFLREAITAAKLNHPHIVAIHKFGQEYVEGEDVHFLIMEFLEGQTLADLIEKKGELPVEEALSITLQAADALANAHEKDVIHRDIKPENLMIDTRGNVKITDFGLAKVVSTTMQTTKVVGTPHYMSPEQFEGKAIDGRTDIYSLGVTFYYMLTRAKPYEGENTVQIIYAILTNEPRPPMEVNPGVSDDLWAIIKKMIEKDPETRYAGFREVQRDLEAFRDRSLRATVDCPQCGAENPQGRFCRECGAPLVIICPTCSSEEAAGTRHCGQCGSNIALALSVREASTRAVEARSRGELRQALKLYEEILDLEPGNEEAEAATAELRAEVQKLDGLREEAEGLVSRGDFDEALKSVDSAIADLPAAELKSLRTEIQTKVTGKAVAVQRQLAAEALSNHDYDTAVAALEKAVDLDADDPEIQLELKEAKKKQTALNESLDRAREHFDAKRYDLAFSASKKALELSPAHEVAADINARARGFIESADALIDQGREHMAEGRYEEARASFESAVDLLPGETEAESLVAEAVEKIAEFEKRLENAKSLLDAGEHTQAIGVVESLSQERPFDDRVDEVRSVCVGAAEEARKARKIKRLLASGREAEQAGMLEDARAAYEEALALEPEHERAQNLIEKVDAKIADAEGLARLADEHEKEGNLAQARVSLTKLLEIRAGDSALKQRLASIEKRKATLDQAVEQAEAALEAKKLDRAQELAEKALGISPAHQRAEKVRAEVERLRSRIELNIVEARSRIAGEMFDEALKHLEEAEECGYDGPEIEEIRAQAEKGRIGVLKSSATRSFRFDDFEGAIGAYEEVLKVEPKDAEAIAGRKAAIRKQRSLRRESPLLKAAASILLLLGLGAVQLLAVSKPLEASEGEGEGTVALRPPVKEAVDVETKQEKAFERKDLDPGDYQRMVLGREWNELRRIALEEGEKFPEDESAKVTRDWVQAMIGAEAISEPSARYSRLKELELPTIGPLADFAAAARDSMLKETRDSVVNRDQMIALARAGDLDLLTEALEAAAELDAGDEDGMAFVAKLRRAVDAAASKTPAEAIRLVYSVEPPTTGILRAHAQSIIDARAEEVIREGLRQAWELEATDYRAASKLYTAMSNALQDSPAPEAFIRRAAAGARYIDKMHGGQSALEKAEDAQGFRAADREFRAAKRFTKDDEERRDARKDQAQARIDAVLEGLETFLVARWPKSQEEWDGAPRARLEPVYELWMVYWDIKNREEGLTHEQAWNLLGELARKQGE